MSTSGSPGNVARRGIGALIVCASATALALATAPAGSAAPPQQGEISFPGSVPAWATASADAGATPADTTVEGEVYLPLRDEQGAQALATAVSTPGNPQYGQYLSAKQWIKQFSPTKKDFQAVEDYLTSSGLTIYAEPASRQYIVFRGPASTVGPAFGTALHDYQYAGGMQHAPDSVPTLPESVGSRIAGLSIDSSRALTRPSHVTPLGEQPTAAVKRASNANPKALKALPKYTCSNYFGENTGPTPKAYGSKVAPTFLCGYLPDQLRSGYGLNKMITAGNDGTGQTIAIIDAYASPSVLQDTNDYMRAVGSPLLTRFSEIKPAEFVDTDLCQGASGWQGEETLDVESAHSIAPGASILYVGGFNCGGGLDIAMSNILDNQLANIVSNSYGNYGEAVPGSVITGEQNIQLQAAAEGIGLYFSSGDSGDESMNLGYTSPDFPASSPFVTSVGGTSKAIGANGATEFNTGWGDVLDKMALNKHGKVKFTEPLPGTLWGGGAGGGTSAFFAQPAYQQGVVPDSLADSVDGTPSRVSPDVAALADPYTGFQIALRPIDDSTCTPSGDCQVGDLEYETYGGTSLASPITAAEMALVQQATGRTIGFANPVLYAAAQADSSTFSDVPAQSSPVALAYTSAHSGNDYLVTLGQDTSLQTATGYDNVTGLGEISVPRVAAYLSQTSASAE
jgi:subtilase family serine protease